MEYKSLKQFAMERNITIRSLQKHIKNHEEELAGHVIRYGPPRGTFIDGEAEDFLSGLLIGHPLAVVDTSTIEENKRLKNELDELKGKVISLMEERDQLKEIASAAEKKAIEAENKLALSELTATHTEEKVHQLEDEVQNLRTNLSTVTERAEQAEDSIQKLKSRSWWQRLRRIGED